MILENIDFGKFDAESESNIGEYFVDTGVFTKIKKGKKFLILGRKGSGKTALFKLATSEKIGRKMIDMDFSSYPWTVHASLKENGISPENAYLISCKFTFLVAICNEWAKNCKDKKLLNESKKIISRIYGTDEPNFFEWLIDKFKRIKKIKLPDISSGSLGAIELEDKETGFLSNTLSRWIDVLKEFVLSNFISEPITIKLDRLDDGWNSSEETKLIIIGIMKAAKEINLLLEIRDHPQTIVVFLRSDIYNELRFNDKNKFNQHIEILEWSDEKLIEVASKRISKSLSLSCSSDEAWNNVFSQEPMRQSAKISSYILKRTMGRPRDIIAFCHFCQEIAVQK